MVDGTQSTVVDISTTNTTAIVDVKSAWLSKINWVQAVQTIATLVTFASGGKFNIDVNQQLAIVTVINLVGAAATWIMRTWFNGTVSPASLPTVAK